MSSKEILKSAIDIADLHADRLNKAFFYLASLSPFTVSFLETLSDENLGFLELMTSRFGKLQDVIGSKVFPSLLTILQEDIEGKSVLDKLHMLEKLSLLPSAKAWMKMRELRNLVTHEYPDEIVLMVENLNEVFVSSQELVVYWGNLRKKVITAIENYPFD